MMDGPGEQQVLAAFLAEREAPCPRCAYNLRGVESDRCPECGQRLELALVKRRRLGGWAPFLLLVFGWLLIAGGINTTREARRIVAQRDAVLAANQRVAAARASLQTQLKRVQEQFDQSLEMRLPEGFGSRTFRQFQEETNREFKTMLDQQRAAVAQQMQRQLASLAPRARPTPTLAQVWMGEPPLQKAGGIWAASLAVLGCLGLLLTAVAATRRRGTPAGLVWVAAGLFLLYAAWHVMQFVRELA